MRAAWLGVILLFGCEASNEVAEAPCDASDLCCCAGDNVLRATCESGKPTCPSITCAVSCANASTSRFCRFEPTDAGSSFPLPDTSTPPPDDTSVDAPEVGDVGASD